MPYHASALRVLLETLRVHAADRPFTAVGHRLVHGGAAYTAPRRLSPDLLRALHDLIPLAPEHQPQALAVIAAVTAAHPTLPQVVCFDTAFHRTLPEVAQVYALPLALTDEGRLRRYGFHGLSYESVHAALAREDAAAANGRLIIAHLGNGASLCAVRASQRFPAQRLYAAPRSDDSQVGGLVTQA